MARNTGISIVILLLAFNSLLVLTRQINNNDRVLATDLRIINAIVENNIQLYLQQIVVQPIIQNVLDMVNAYTQSVTTLIDNNYNCNPITETSASSCRQILALNPLAASGVYNITTSAGAFEVYCEMVINGGGYTFIEKSSLALLKNKNVLSSIYTDRSQVLLRLIATSDNQYQPYTIVQQLDNYAEVPIAVMVDETTEYTKTINKGDRYIYIGLIPASFVSQGTLMGLLMQLTRLQVKLLFN